MLYVILCTDKPGQLTLRQQHRPAHLAYLAQYEDRLFAAGPTLDDAGAMSGSLLILDFADRAEAEAFSAGDPYAKAGLFDRLEIRPWKKVLPPG
jgi:uncharacterized protein YciI